MKLYTIVLPLLLCLCANAAKAQDTILQQLPTAYLSKVSARLEDLKGDIDKKSQKAISQLQKQQNKQSFILNEN